MSDEAADALSRLTLAESLPAPKRKGPVGLLDLPDERLTDVLRLSLQTCSDPFVRRAMGARYFKLVCRRIKQLAKDLDLEFAAIRLTDNPDRQLSAFLDSPVQRSLVKELAVQPLNFRPCHRPLHRRAIQQRELVFRQQSLRRLLEQLPALETITVWSNLPRKADNPHDRWAVSVKFLPVLRCTSTNAKTNLALLPGGFGWWSNEYRFGCENELATALMTIVGMLDLAAPLKPLLAVSPSFQHSRSVFGVEKDLDGRFSYSIKAAMERSSANGLTRENETHFDGIFRLCRSIKLRCFVELGGPGHRLLPLPKSPVEVLRMRKLIPRDMAFVRHWFARFERLKTVGILFIERAKDDRESVTPDQVVQVIESLPPTVKNFSIVPVDGLIGQEERLKTVCAS